MRGRARLTDMPTEKGWAVVGPYGLYTGWWMTRRAAIEAHVSGKVLGPGSDPERVPDVWKLCKREGDRAVRVAIKYET
jgi:hypothetical protein